MRRAEGGVQPAARARQTSIAESFGVAGRGRQCGGVGEV